MKFLSGVYESLRIAVDALRANKIRGTLTTLGIIIGIVAVSLMMTAANGLENDFKESISAIGTNVLYVSRTPWIVHGNWFEFRNRRNLQLKEAEKLEARLDDALAVNPTTGTRKNIKFRSTVMEDVRIIGTTDKYIQVSSGVPEFGRFIMASEVQYKKRVCVIGPEIRERLFKDVDPINKKMKIGRFHYRVVGIMEKQGGAGFFGGPNFDNQIYVPITAFMANFGGTNRNFDIAVKARDNVDLSDLEYAIIGEMRKIRKLKPVEKDDFSINQMDTILDAYNNVMGVIVMIGLVITGVSLFVGGIGVMNIMFVSVTERTREIGIRKAIGARRRTILIQFLFEAALICLLGGAIGLLFAYGLTEVINRFVLPASISIPIIFLALVVSAAVGMIAGIIPAFRASRLNPIEALRYE